MPLVSPWNSPYHPVSQKGGQKYMPRAFPCNHFPPYADIFHRLNPGGIIILTRLIQIENQIGGQYLAGIITDYDRTPGSMAGDCIYPLFP